MKIYRMPIDDKFRPNQQNFIWPPQNAQAGGDYGVEQDFDNWLLDRPHMLVDNPALADYIYVPIFWNRYYINTIGKDGAWGGGVEELAEEFEKCHKYDIPKFTVAEADIKCLKPQIEWKDTIIFVSSRRNESGGIDIPLLSAPHPFPLKPVHKKWLASFLGNLMTDGVRIDMHEELKNREDCRVEHAGSTQEEFTETMLSSYIALCPRGQGAQSFRMYEAMQLGTLPLYISDLDCRPFKKWIDWDICCLYIDTVKGLNEYLDAMNDYRFELLEMGDMAGQTYKKSLMYGKWCPYVIKELEQL